MSSKKKKTKKANLPSFNYQEVQHKDLKAIIERATSAPLSTADQEQLMAAIDTLAFLTQELEKKSTSLSKFRQMLFGPSGEKTKDVLGRMPALSSATT